VFATARRSKMVLGFKCSVKVLLKISGRPCHAPGDVYRFAYQAQEEVQKFM